MNQYVRTIWLLLAVTAARGHAGTPPLPWGPPTNGIQLSLTSNASTNGADTAQSLMLLIRIRNLSDRMLYVDLPLDPLRVFSFSIRSPSGRDLSTTPDRDKPGSRSTAQLKPKQERAYRRIALASICDLSEPGSYTIVVRQVVFLPAAYVQVTSNPLSITLPAGPSPKPPSGTNVSR